MPGAAGAEGASQSTVHPRQTKKGVDPKTLARSGNDTTSDSGTASKTNEGYGPGPVTVYATRDVYKPALTQAIKLWNKQVGFTVFQLINTPKADVVVTLGNTEKKKAAGLGVPGAWTPSGRGHVILDENMFSTDVAASPDVADKAAYTANLALTIQHELGHSIGLAHPGPEQNPYEFNQGGMGTKGSGIMGSAAYSSLDAGGVPTDQTKPATTYNERDMVTQLREQGQANFYQRGRIAKQTGAEVDDLSNLTDKQWRQIADTWVDPGGGNPPPQQQPPSGNPPPSSPPSSPPSTSTSSSSAPAPPPVDPRVAQLESLFRSAYITLWGEPPTEAYVKQAAQSGMNVTEFVARERKKDDWQFTKAYKDEAKGLYASLKQMGAV